MVRKNRMLIPDMPTFEIKIRKRESMCSNKLLYYIAVHWKGGRDVYTC